MFFFFRLFSLTKYDRWRFVVPNVTSGGGANKTSAYFANQKKIKK